MTSKPQSVIIRNLNINPVNIQDKIDILSELMRFSTYKNLSFIQRHDSDTESETEDETEDNGPDNGIEIEFIGKRRYNKGSTQKDKSKKKLKVATKKVSKGKNDKLEQAIAQMQHVYKLFVALDGLNPSDIDQYLDDTCRFKRFTGPMVLKRIVSPQCLIFEVIGLVRKKYHLIIEKKLLNYFPRDFFRTGQIYLFHELIINYVKKERVVVFMIDTQTTSKLISSPLSFLTRF